MQQSVPASRQPFPVLSQRVPQLCDCCANEFHRATRLRLDPPPLQCIPPTFQGLPTLCIDMRRIFQHAQNVCHGFAPRLGHAISARYECSTSSPAKLELVTAFGPNCSRTSNTRTLLSSANHTIFAPSNATDLALPVRGAAAGKAPSESEGS